MDSSQRHELQIHSFSFNDPNNTLSEIVSPHADPTLTMNGNTTIPTRTDSLAGLHGVWTMPTSQTMRPRPATIHEGFSFCSGQGFDGIPAWDSSSLQMQQAPSDGMCRPIPVSQDFYPATTMQRQPWPQKVYDGGLDVQGLDSGFHTGQGYATDEPIPILDLRGSGPPMAGDSMAFDGGVNPRRMSGSSFTVSTSGALSEMTSYEDFSTALSDAPSLTSDYPPLSNRTSMISSTQLSPVASPRMTPQSRSELVRTHSRGRASPSPRPGVRAAPYSVESARNKRWSTGSYGPNSNRRPSPFVYHQPHDAFSLHARLSTRHSPPTVAPGPLPLSYGNLQAAQQHPYLYNNMPAFNRNSMFLPTQLSSQAFHPEAHQFENPPPLLSQGLFRMLQSNADPHSAHSHYADLSDPPDLYASLHEEQLPPPPEDMNPSDPDLVPHEQDLRFEGDLYTPRWVRGHGNKREGWCGICKPGRWLVLKNSAFWYDKSFSHGISAATGSSFQEPRETRRMDGNPDVWEGLCGSCNDWIALVSSKKKGTTWFRHAYKCHTHPKVKDTPKRRRESNNPRSSAAANTARSRVDPLTPQTTPALLTAATPTPVRTRAPVPSLIQPLRSPTTSQQSQLQPAPVPSSRPRALPAQHPPRTTSLMSPVRIPGVDELPNMI